MAKIRVHELAKELGIPSKEMVVTLQNLGLDVKNHMSTVEDSRLVGSGRSWLLLRFKRMFRRNLIQRPADGRTCTKVSEPQPQTRTKPPVTDKSMPNKPHQSGTAAKNG
jgi:translation initiation factor IF-2